MERQIKPIQHIHVLPARIMERDVFEADLARFLGRWDGDPGVGSDGWFAGVKVEDPRGGADCFHD